ncbi:hypothetical protein KUCAC02_006352, partial [Chaenocephalus aceratus]
KRGLCCVVRHVKATGLVRFDALMRDIMSHSVNAARVSTASCEGTSLFDYGNEVYQYMHETITVNGCPEYQARATAKLFNVQLCPLLFTTSQNPDKSVKVDVRSGGIHVEELPFSFPMRRRGREEEEQTEKMGERKFVEYNKQIKTGSGRGERNGQNTFPDSVNKLLAALLKANEEHGAQGSKNPLSLRDTHQLATVAAFAASEGHSHPRVVELPKTEEGLGFNVMGGKEQNSPIYISRIIPGGVAERHGGLKRGDQLLSVNGVSVEGEHHEKAVELLKAAKDSVKLVVRYTPKVLEEMEARFEKLRTARRRQQQQILMQQQQQNVASQQNHMS